MATMTHTSTAYAAAYAAAFASGPSQLWQVTTIAPDGRFVTTHNHTTTQAVREMLRRRKRGHRLPSPCARPEPDLPVPDAMLTPCAQPGAQRAPEREGVAG